MKTRGLRRRCSFRSEDMLKNNVLEKEVASEGESKKPGVGAMAKTRKSKGTGFHIQRRSKSRDNSHAKTIAHQASQRPPKQLRRNIVRLHVVLKHTRCAKPLAENHLQNHRFEREWLRPQEAKVSLLLSFPQSLQPRACKQGQA